MAFFFLFPLPISLCLSFWQLIMHRGQRVSISSSAPCLCRGWTEACRTAALRVDRTFAAGAATHRTGARANVIFLPLETGTTADKAKNNSPTKGGRISGSYGITSTHLAGIAQNRSDQQGRRLHHVRTVTTPHPHGHALDRLSPLLTELLVGLVIWAGEVLPAAGWWWWWRWRLPRLQRSGVVVVIIVGIGRGAVELMADQEELLVIAPRGRDVLHHLAFGGSGRFDLVCSSDLL